MLKKTEAQPGITIKFDRDPFIMVTPLGRSEMTMIAGYAKPGSAFDGAAAVIKKDDMARIVTKPKKYSGINCIQLNVNGVDAYFYWTEVYYNATIVGVMDC